MGNISINHDKGRFFLENPVGFKILIMSILVVGIILTIYFYIDSQNRDLVDKIIMQDQGADLSKLNDVLITNSNFKKSASDILDECGKDAECVIKHLQLLSNSESQEKILLIVSDIISSWENGNFYCHVQAHHVGEFLSGYFKGDVFDAFSHADGKCGNGLYHGIIENYLSLKVILNGVKVEELQITQPCIELGSENGSYVGLECVHGMGHGLAVVYNLDVTKAVKRCDEFLTNVEQSKCYSGVFMENGVTYFENGGGMFDDGDLLYPCYVMEPKYQRMCYNVQASYILKQNNFLPMIAFQHCEKILFDIFIKSCYNGVGLYMANYYFYDIGKTATMCNDANLYYQKDCILGSVFSITMYVKPELGSHFCNLISNNHYRDCINYWLYTKTRHV